MRRAQELHPNGSSFVGWLAGATLVRCTIGSGAWHTTPLQTSLILSFTRNALDVVVEWGVCVANPNLALPSCDHACCAWCNCGSGLLKQTCIQAAQCRIPNFEAHFALEYFLGIWPYIGQYWVKFDFEIWSLFSLKLKGFCESMLALDLESNGCVET